MEDRLDYAISTYCIEGDTITPEFVICFEMEYNSDASPELLEAGMRKSNLSRISKYNRNVKGAVQNATCPKTGTIIIWYKRGLGKGVLQAYQ